MTRTPVEESQKEEWTCSHTQAWLWHVNILSPKKEKKGGKRNLQNDVVLLYTILEFNPNSGFAEIVT